LILDELFIDFLDQFVLLLRDFFVKRFSYAFGDLLGELTAGFADSINAKLVDGQIGLLGDREENQVGWKVVDVHRHAKLDSHDQSNLSMALSAKAIKLNPLNPFGLSPINAQVGRKVNVESDFFVFRLSHVFDRDREFFFGIE